MINDDVDRGTLLFYQRHQVLGSGKPFLAEQVVLHSLTTSDTIIEANKSYMVSCFVCNRNSLFRYNKLNRWLQIICKLRLTFARWLERYRHKMPCYHLSIVQISLRETADDLTFGHVSVSR